MLALPALLAAPTPASETAPGALLLVAVVVGLAIAVLLSIALDLRRLRRASRLRTIHGVMGAAFTAIVVAGALSMSLAIGAAPAATADQPEAPIATERATEPAPVPVPPEPESIDRSDVTDPATDIQLPTLSLN